MANASHLLILALDEASAPASPAPAAPAASASGTQAPGTNPPPPQDPLGGMGMFVMMALLLVVFFFFMRRSQKRQQTEHQKMVENLKPGAKVMLNSGLVALVNKIDKENNEVVLTIDEEKRVTARYNWGAVAKLFDKEEVANVSSEYTKKA